MDSGSAFMKGRILVLTGDPPETPGGMEHLIREMKKGLEGLGYTTEVLHRHNASPSWVARPANRWQSHLADALMGWYLGRGVRQRMGEDVVAVLSNAFFGWPLPRHPERVKKIHFYHGTYRGQSDAIRLFISRAGACKLKWWDSMVLERLSGRGKQILCNSEQTRGEVRRFFGYEGATVWLPLDTAHFRPLDKLEARRSLRLAERKPVGLFVGSTQPAKGFPVVRRLIEALPEVEWILALQGHVPQDMEQNDGVTVFPNAASEILPRLYSAADFTVCPSRYESFGYVVAEALACGTPVIAAPGGASRFFLSEPPLNRLLVSRPDAVEDFLATARRVIENPDSYRQMVIESVRPKIEEIMAPGNWWRRFSELTGL